MRWLKDDFGQWSHTKFFSVVGYIVLIGAFIHYVLHGGEQNEMIWMIFSSVVIGNRSINKWIEKQP